MIRPIAIYPDPILSQKSRDVKPEDDITNLIRDMCDTLEACPTGAALAAVQIGVPLNLIVMKTDKNKPHRVFKNLRIDETSVESQEHEEGCLSIPGVFEKVKRAKEVTVSYEEQQTVKVETFKGFEAFIMQHEAEHLAGEILVKDKATVKYVLNKMKKWIAKGIYYPMGSKPDNRLWTPETINFDALRRACK